MHAPQSQPGSKTSIAGFSPSPSARSASSMAISAHRLFMRSGKRCDRCQDGVTPDEVIGIISLMLWTLTIIVTVKYVVFCCAPTTRAKAARCHCWRCCRANSRDGIAGFWCCSGYRRGAVHRGRHDHAALSVMSAVEGMKFVAPDLTRFVLPVSV